MISSRSVESWRLEMILVCVKIIIGLIVEGIMSDLPDRISIGHALVVKCISASPCSSLINDLHC